MQTQIRSLVINPVVQIITVSIVAFTGLFHLALGAAYADSGSPFELIALASLYASSGGVKSQAAFLIIGGLFIMFSCALLLWNLRKNGSNKKASNFSWIICVLVVLFDFTGAIIAAQIYTPAAKYVTANGFGLDVYNNRKHMYGFALADTIITFIFALPSVFYLFLATTYHKQMVENDDDKPIENQEQQVGHNNVEMQNQVQPQEPVTGHYKPSPPKSIELERQHSQQNGQNQKRMGSVMYKEYNSQRPQIQRGQREQLPHFNTSQNVQLGSASHIPSSRRSPSKQDGPKRSKTQFAHSEPDFNVQLTMPPGRRSIDPKVLEGEK